MKTKFFSAILSAMILTTANLGITTSAEEATEVPVPVMETTETVITDDMGNSSLSEEGDMSTQEFKEIMSEIAGQGTVTVEPDYYGDDYYDTDGNATLIKSEQIIYNTEEMQFIAVTTKDGHVFYVLINYSAASGEDSVYFLNKVDDYDLYALLYAGDESDEESSSITPEEAAQAAENANGRVTPETDSGKSDSDSADSSQDSETSAEKTVQTSAAPVNKNSIYLVVGVVALIGIGFAGFMFMKKKPKNKTVSNEETEEYEDDDFKFYDNDENQDE
ncbi:MAG: DUF4366 domain-containing protein [Ruminococcus sp.]|nr:DUF4366 domain-containing protein [Ruminococcus sp.]